MKIYLDNCCFNRPFDDQSHIKIYIESEAKLFIQDQIRCYKIKLIWSYILDFENSENPFEERKNAIERWKKFAFKSITENKSILSKANELRTKFNIKAKDALHIACAIDGKANYFITTDNFLLKRLKSFKEIIVFDPVSFIKQHGD